MAERAGCGDFDPNSLPAGEALRRMRATVKAVTGGEIVALADAHHRVAAAAITAAAPVPNSRNAAMDGYAVNALDLPTGGACTLRLAGAAAAGHPFTGILQRGQCARIMTGAPLPAGADTVVMQEVAAVNVDTATVTIGAGQRKNQFVREVGGDFNVGDTILSAGDFIDAAALGVLAAAGAATVRVVRKPRVAFFSTGDELRAVDQPLAAGELHDSNRHTLGAMLRELAVEAADFGIVRDDPAATGRALGDAAAKADAVIATGGASVGDADYVRRMSGEMGRVHFWKIAMKPGRPLSFGEIGGALFFGLPGNPVSVMVTFRQFVLPALRRLMGLRETVPLRINARLTTSLQKKPGRLEFQRGVLALAKNGEYTVRTTGSQDSAVLSSMRKANCYIVLPTAQGDTAAGAMVTVEPFGVWI